MTKTITLSGDVLTPLRDALYSCLTNNTDTLNAALTRPERETSSLVHTAYLELSALGALLGRIGWQHQEQQPSLTLSDTAEARSIVEALTIELQVEEDLALSRERAGEQAGAEAKGDRAQTVYEALSTIGAAAVAAGLLDAKAAEDA
ncbi:MAG: hypothetical protein ACYCUM_13925 [Solirubrobacteraceae bacterium]